MDGLGVSENGLGSAPDLPALAIKAETNVGSPFRRGPRGEGDLVGKNAVSAAAAAVRGLSDGEGANTPPPSPFTSPLMFPSAHPVNHTDPSRV